LNASADERIKLNGRMTIFMMMIEGGMGKRQGRWNWAEAKFGVCEERL
jgi:hypothetical protein